MKARIGEGKVKFSVYIEEIVFTDFIFDFGS